MMHELSRHQSTRSGFEDAEQEDSTENGDAPDDEMGEDSDEPVDSRWAALKQLKEQLKK